MEQLTPVPAASLGSPRHFHRWVELTFLHWKVPAELLAPTIPTSLIVDTYEGHGWLGLVLFHLSARPAWGPPVPGVSSFLETNVRTYVRHQGGEPGVWFHSLDAARAIPVYLARKFWHLPYFYSKMTLQKLGQRYRYGLTRVKTPEVYAHCSLEIDNPPYMVAEAGSLEHFLLERYSLYSTKRGKLYRGRVAHEPYQYVGGKLLELQQNLLATHGFEITRPPDHVVYCPGVRVKVYPLLPVD